MKFEWDQQKAKANLRKHGVRFQEAASIFGDTLAITFEDPDHSISENRYITFGLSQYKRLLTVSHAERGDITRIISARRMDRKERKTYEEG
jgi:uncharacterized DUF497 family protein